MAQGLPPPQGDKIKMFFVCFVVVFSPSENITELHALCHWACDTSQEGTFLGRGNGSASKQSRSSSLSCLEDTAHVPCSLKTRLHSLGIKIPVTLLSQMETHLGAAYGVDQS